MSRRKNIPDSEPLKEVPNKRSKSTTNDNEILPFTPVEILKDITINDKFVSLVGYVDSEDKIKNFKSKDDKNLTLFKFLINNNGGIKISCFAWNDDAIKFSNMIEVNDILIIQNAMAKGETNFNQGNSQIELLLKSHTKLSRLGVFNHMERAGEILQIDNFENMADLNGWIKIQGYLRDEFYVQNKNRDQEYTGSATDGKFRVEILITNAHEKIEFHQGQKIQVVGEIQEDGNACICIRVHDLSQIKIVDEETMPLSKLVMITEIVKRKSQD